MVRQRCVFWRGAGLLSCLRRRPALYVGAGWLNFRHLEQPVIRPRPGTQVAGARSRIWLRCPGSAGFAWRGYIIVRTRARD
jgi:hypothetical protein